METKVKAKYSRISIKKARPVAKLIKNINTGKAQSILKYNPSKAAKIISKLLKSAIASAKDKEADLEKLYIKEIRVDQGPGLKRRKFRARGRADIIVRPTSHITIIVSDQEKKDQKPRLRMEKKFKESDGSKN